MAPTAVNLNKRYWLDYTTGITEHSMQIRLAASTSDATALSFYSQFLTAVQGLLSDEFAVLGVRAAAAGSNVILPIDAGALMSFTGTDTDSPLPSDVPKELVWVGRGETTGKRWRLSLYGAQVGFPPDYRFEGVGMLPSLQAAIDVINDFNGLLQTIDQDSFVAYPYVNINNNSYWETRQRRG